jgi:branched-chain amino acid transport system permease protein
MNYFLHILILISIYLILSLSLNLLVGYTGLLSVCHAAFYGFGAYVFALLMMRVGLHPILALITAIVATSLFSLVVSIPSSRLRGDYFVLATLAFQFIAFDLFNNLVSLTGGPYGITGIPAFHFFGIPINTPARYVLLCFAVAGLCLALMRMILSSPFGQVLRAVREDELATEALGKNVSATKVKAFALASAFAAVAGVLYAMYMTFIDPSSFTIDESIFVLSIVLVGGLGNIKGPIVGTVLLQVLAEALRFVGIPNTVAPNVRQMIYGALLVGFMYFRPQGLVGVYKFE